MSKKVVIFGGGIAGLVTAHELIERGHEVTLYELSNEFGGLAKTRRIANNIPIEHSWRAYAAWYPNLMSIMRRIPYKDFPDKTVYNALVQSATFILPKDEERKNGNLIPPVRLTDLFVLVPLLFRVLVSGPKRNKYKISKENFTDLVENKLTQDGYDKFITQIGPGLGLDRERPPLDQVGNFVAWNFLSFGKYRHKDKDFNGREYYHSDSDPWKVMIEPTSEAWIEPWIDYLSSKGVNIISGTGLQRIYIQPINSTYSRKTYTLDQYQLTDGSIIDATDKQIILATDPSSASKIVKDSGLENSCVSQLNNIVELEKFGSFKEIGFFIGFTLPINLPLGRDVISFADSEYSILIYLQSNYWRDGVSIGNDNVSTISGTVTDSSTPGKLFGLPSGNVTIEQLKQEIMHQLERCEQFQRVVRENNDGKDFTYFKNNSLNHYEIWNDWYYDAGKKELVGNDFWLSLPGTEEFRPTTNTEIVNLKMAGVYTDTSFGLWSMEGATESGRKAAKAIDNKVCRTEHRKILPFRITGFIDDGLYTVGLPSIYYIFLVLFIIGLFYFLRWLICGIRNGKFKCK